MSIIATVIGITTYVIRRLTNKLISPKWNYILWGTFIITLFIPIIIPSKFSIYNLVDINQVRNIGKSSIKSNVEIEGKNEIIQNQSSNMSEMFKKRPLYFFADIYFIYTIFRLLMMIRSYRNILNKTNFEEVKAYKPNKILKKCKKKLGINKNIKILKQDFIKSPSIMGLYNVNIFITEDGLKLDNQDLTCVFMHELSHYKRKDNIVNALILIAKQIYWFNPIILRLFKYVRTDIEIATDEMALDNIEEIEDVEYCETILKVVKMNQRTPEPVLGIGGEFKEIEQRFNKIFSRDEYKNHSNIIMICSIILITFMWLVLSPSSYGENRKIGLYLEINNHEMIKLEELNEKFKTDDYQTIYINRADEIKIKAESGQNIKYITYDEINLGKYHRITGEESDILDELESGNYFYEFTVKNDKDKEIKYGINLKIE